MSVAPVLDLHPDGVVDRLRDLCDWARQTATTLPAAGSATQIDRLAAVQDAHAALAALEAAVIVDFARDQVAAASGRASVDYRKLEMSIADQIGKACRVGPALGRTKLGLARALILDLRDYLVWPSTVAASCSRGVPRRITTVAVLTTTTRRVSGPGRTRRP